MLARAALLGAGLSLGAAGPGLTQDGDASGGLQVALSFSEQLRSDADGTALRTDLGLSLSSQTRSQRLVLDLSGGIELGLDNGLDTDIVDPRIGLEYGLENRATALTFSTSYRRSDIDTLSLVDTLEDGTALVLDTGQRADLSGTLDLVFGREAPFGATVTLAHAETRFTDTTSAALVNSTTNSGALNLRFDISRVATAFARLSFSDLDRATGTDVRRASLGASLDLTLSEAVTATFDLGATRIDQDAPTGSTVARGAYYGASLVAERPNGSLSLLLDSDISETGRRSTLQVNRSLTLPRGAITAGAGLSRNSTAGSTDPLYSLGFVQDMPRAQFRADFSQRFSTTTTGIETLESRLNLGLQQDLGPLTRLTAALNLRDSNQLIATGTDSRQADLSLDYAHDITPDWALFGGVRHSLRSTDGQADQTEDTVFFGLRTSLTWRP